MSLQVEKLEGNMAKLTIEAAAEEFENAIEKAYQKKIYISYYYEQFTCCLFYG